MATLDINCPVETGAFLRQLAKRLEALSLDIPDNCPTGGTNVLRIDSAPQGANVSMQLVTGPNASTKKHVQ
jgi:hypothetical protein